MIILMLINFLNLEIRKKKLGGGGYVNYGKGSKLVVYWMILDWRWFMVLLWVWI